MPTVFSTSPHFDDFDQTKQFVRILFRPGRAVQARELTQLQTIIQSQVERFGKGIYRDGTFITPPETTFDNTYSFVKLTETTGGTTSDDVIADLVGSEISNADGVRALIIDHAVSTTAGDPPTLFVKYEDGGANKALTFSDGDTLTSGSTTLTAISSSSTGNGVAFSLGEAVVFARGNFLFVNSQTHVISKYSPVTNKIIGLNITESVVDSDDDTSLLDPATGTFNFFAPGADRYKANLALSSRELEFTQNTDPNFVEIARIEDGEVISLNEEPQYSVLGDTIAKRTFDESGNYVVDPFDFELFEHLRTSSTANNIAEIQAVRDGIFLSSNGGNENLFVTKVNSGKAYVRGYEVENLKTSYLTISKARDNTDTISSVVPTSLSSFVKVTDVDSIPEFEDIITLSLKDAFKSGNIATNGDEIGTAKARGLIYLTGNVAPGRGGGDDRTAEFELHLFDINMNAGSEFERDVKQIASTNSYTNFSANIVPVTTQLSGGITFNNASTTVLGSGTRFQTELKSGDVITHSNATFTHRLVVSAITDDVTLTTVNTPLGNVENTFAPYSINEALINNADKDVLVFKLPADNVKEVDDSVITYSVKRQFTGITLSSGATTLGPLDAGENFAPFSTDNYVAVITSGTRAGELIPIISSQVTRDTVARTIEFDFSSEESLSSETATIYTTVTKGAGAGSRLKTKTLQTNQTIDIIDQVTAQKSIISLQKADGFKLNSVLMSNVETTFGTAFNTDRTANITNRYDFDNGQKSSFYDVAKIKLKPGQAKPTHPIRINFDFFSHSNSGDYFDVSSYGIAYKDIPSTTLGDTKFELRDCIDFRPRINDAGTGFTGTGAPTNQPLFLDPEVDFTLNFKHFLPKISSIGLDENGVLTVFEGVSQLNPIEPEFPGDMIKLAVLEQNAFVYNLLDDVKIKVVPNKRYTMKDIGKIENRVKTLEYYTSLNLLERDAEQTQIQDSLGFDRFKNGFLVDSFTGHGVGDSIDNPDYATAVNYKTRTAGPLVKNHLVNLIELNSSTAQRTSNNYVKTGDIITLPFTEEVVIQNTYASKTNNLNPFNIGLYQGLLKLSPPGDIFFEDTHVGTITVNSTGEFDSLLNQSLIKKDGKNVFGSIADIEQFNTGTTINTDQLPDKLRSLAEVVGALSPSTTTVETTGDEVVKNLDVKPLMRDARIHFTVSGLRPNTTFFAFFDDLNVSSFTSMDTTAVVTAKAALQSNANAQTYANLGNALLTASNVNLNSNSTGSLSGTFNYSQSSLGLTVGNKLFRLTNSPTNDKKSEISFAEATFFSDGVKRQLGKAVLRVHEVARYEPQTQSGGSTHIQQQDTTVTETIEPNPTPKTPTSLGDRLYNFAYGCSGDANDLAWWQNKHPILSETDTSSFNASQLAQLDNALQHFTQGTIKEIRAGSAPGEGGGTPAEKLAEDFGSGKTKVIKNDAFFENNEATQQFNKGALDYLNGSN